MLAKRGKKKNACSPALAADLILEGDPRAIVYSCHARFVLLSTARDRWQQEREERMQGERKSVQCVQTKPTMKEQQRRRQQQQQQQQQPVKVARLVPASKAKNQCKQTQLLQYRDTQKSCRKEESCPRLEFLSENGRVLVL